MANPTAIDSLPAQLEATTTKDSVTLNPEQSYRLTHNQVDEGGNADVDEIMLGFNGTTAAAGSGAKLGTLSYLCPVTIRRVSTLEFKASANNPHFTITPIGP